MNKNYIYNLFTLLLLGLLQINGFSQPANKDDKKTSAEWIRVQSDNGEFSIEVPTNSTYFFDKDGFMQSFDRTNYHLRNMHLLNSYFEKNILSFEAYEGDKNALEGYIEKDKLKGVYSEINKAGVKIKQIITKNEDSYLVRQYFNSKKFIYVLTAASKTQETPIIKRFLDSLVFKPNSKDLIDEKILTFSKLRRSPIEFSESGKDESTDNKTDNKKDDKNVEKLSILAKPNPSYIDLARMNSVKGDVKLKLEFSANGNISKVTVLKTLPDGLLRQSIFAALRIKFFPQIENGKAANVNKTVVYNFSIY